MNHALAPWSSFYVISGSAAAALTGLVFVVITLVAGQERTSEQVRDGVETFSSPTVVHFCAALYLSAVMVAPWRSLTGPSVLVGLASVWGPYYAGRVLARMIRMGDTYIPDLADRLWYAFMPLAAYLAIGCAAILLSWYAQTAPFVLAGSTLLLIFVGIRNAWDTVTYIAVVDRGPS